MNPDSAAAQTFIDAATEAIKRGDRRSAHRYAERAAALAPQTEQPWLLLAFLGSPKAAQYYLGRALQANPNSQRASAAQEWLKKSTAAVAQPATTAAPNPAVTTPIRVKRRQPAPALGRALRFSLWLAVLVVVLGLAIFSRATRQVQSQDTALASFIQVMLNAGAAQKSTLTLTAAPSTAPATIPTATRTPFLVPTATASPLPSQTASPMPTSTASPLPTGTASLVPTATHTSQPTAQPTLTEPPAPTQPQNTTVTSTNYTVRSGDTLNLIAQRYNISLQDLIAANNLANPSFIRAGQVIILPRGGLPGATRPTAKAGPTQIPGKGKEIQIDISEQHLYAYENGQLVQSYVVSTGIGNSTRIGTFKVLDKIPNAYSNAFNIWMPWWMGIYYSGTLENGIHGLPKLWNGVELWGNLLGQPATYGCIEARTFEIKKLYNWAEIGTPVIIRR